MLRDGHLVCDGCGASITRISTAPEEGWDRLHNLCSACFERLWATSIERPG